MEEPLDRRRVAGSPRERPPEEVLVERERAAVRVAVAEVDVQPLEVMWAEHHTLQYRRLEVRQVPREPLLDAVGVPLAKLVVPGPVADVDRSRRIALRHARQLLQLDPEDPLPVGRPRRIDRQRLADDDRRLGGQQAALGFVHGP